MSARQPHWLAGRCAMVVGSGEAAEHVASSLSDGGAALVRADASLVDSPEIAAAFDAAARRERSIDILVHAGTRIPPMPAGEIGLEAWRSFHSADLDGRFLYAAEYVRRKRAGQGAGAILFLMPSAAPGAGRAASLTAHGALDNLVKSLAVEWARDGIRVNAIASRTVDRPEMATAPRIASLGHLACYLVSDYAAYVTGCVMGIDET